MDWAGGVSRAVNNAFSFLGQSNNSNYAALYGGSPSAGHENSQLVANVAMVAAGGAAAVDSAARGGAAIAGSVSQTAGYQVPKSMISVGTQSAIRNVINSPLAWGGMYAAGTVIGYNAARAVIEPDNTWGNESNGGSSSGIRPDIYPGETDNTQLADTLANQNAAAELALKEQDLLLKKQQLAEAMAPTPVEPGYTQEYYDTQLAILKQKQAEDAAAAAQAAIDAANDAERLKLLNAGTEADTAYTLQNTEFLKAKIAEMSNPQGLALGQTNYYNAYADLNSVKAAQLAWELDMAQREAAVSGGQPAVMYTKAMADYDAAKFGLPVADNGSSMIFKPITSMKQLARWS